MLTLKMTRRPAHADAPEFKALLRAGAERWENIGFKNGRHGLAIIHGLFASRCGEDTAQWRKDQEARRIGSEIESVKYTNPLIDPEGFTARPVISCSLFWIGSGHSEWTFARSNGVALILDVPVYNIITAAPGDIGTAARSNLEYLRPLPKPSELLPHANGEFASKYGIISNHTLYNEIVVTGHNSATGTTIKIAGGMVIEPQVQSHTNLELVNGITSFCERLGLPLISVPGSYYKY